eukprot:84516_1
MEEKKQEQKEEQVVLHKWSFKSKYDENKKQIILTVSDEITEKTWQKIFDASDYDDPGTKYDEMHPIFEASDLACGYPDDDASPLRIVFMKDGDQQYEFNLPLKS